VTQDSAKLTEQAIRALRAAGRLQEAAQLVDQLGPYDVAEDNTATIALGAAVLNDYGDQLAATDPAAADDAYRQAAQAQRLFAAAATSGGEGIARMTAADSFDAKRRTR